VTIAKGLHRAVPYRYNPPHKSFINGVLSTVRKLPIGLAFLRATAAATVAFGALLLAPEVACAQSTASPDLMSIFNTLSPEQQQALLQQVGGQAGGAGGAANPSRSGANQPSNADQQRRRVNAGGEAALPHRLQADDLVIIEPEIQRQKLTWPGGGAVAATQGGVNVPSVSAPGGSPSGAVVAPVVAPPIEVTPEVKERLERLIVLIKSKNPYTLDPAGAVQLPGFAGITLAGLTEAQAGMRLAAEPDLVYLDIKVTFLPVRRLGGAGLKRYGYDLFEQAPSTFAPTTDVPVPSDYVVGPGDQLTVQLYGSQNKTLRLTVGRDGHVSFPELGPISVAGRTFSAVKAEIESRVARQMIGVRASLGMGETRSIQVFVLGEARYPGAYTVSGLATMTGALFAAGGVREIGSLRSIQLKRAGRTISDLDLYDLLMQGDSSHDVKLQPGDVIFIPAIGPTVSIDGEVQRPAIYELKGAISAAAAVQMAGGFTTDADTGKASLSRIDSARRRVVQDIDLSAPGAANELLHNADVLRVARLRPTMDSGVTVDGQVYRPGSYAWQPGLRLSQLLPSLDELKPDADQHYVLIRREEPASKRVAVVSADLAAALRAPGSAADPELTARDRLTVFDLKNGRDRVIKPLMDELQLQSTQQQSLAEVNISGSVKAPGDYPLETGMKVSDLIRAGGSLDTAAYSGSAELSRYVIENGQTRRTQVIEIDLPAVLRGDAAANIALQPFDRLYIKEVSGWAEQEQVTLKGEVRFPGTYPIKRGESLRAVVERAGGLTDQAFAEGAVFTRKELQEREQAQLNRLADRMQNDLTATTMMAARGGQGGAGQAYSLGQSLLTQIKAAKAVGRLVIDLRAALAAAPGSTDDVTLREGDQLIIPKRSQEVTVIGEVQNATSHLYQSDLERDDYINLSGGMTRLADGKKTYVVHANGSVDAAGTHWWVPHTGSSPIRPGDTVVVPLDTERVPALPTWQAVTQILYNIAIAAAAVHAL
jgi:polysaccharide biosynthesis/export protein